MHYHRWKRHGNPDVILQQQERHGKGALPEYGVWKDMKRRCYSPNRKQYKDYGGRGITVCERWRHSFLAFLSDMGERPFLKAQLDRINNDGNYEPQNCRWTTRKVNIRNGRATKLNSKEATVIKLLYSTGKFSYREIGKVFGVGKWAVGDIVRGESWI